MIEDDMRLLGSLKNELRQKRKAYNESIKGLKASIQLLEQDIIAEVLKSGKTIQVGNLMAEYKPTVVFRMRKGNENV